MNWWVKEVSDEVRWDVDGLSIVDPRQVAQIMDLVDPLNEYGFDQSLLEGAVISFRIQKDLGDGIIRLVRTSESFVDAEEPIFALPNVVDDENGPYADFLNHITKTRVKMLNDLIEFEQDLSVDEVEEEIREEENNSFIEGKAVHLFNEIASILDYVPVGWTLDDDEAAVSAADEEESLGDIDDIEEEDTSQISKEESLKWDDEEEEKSEDVYEGGPPDADKEEDAP